MHYYPASCRGAGRRAGGAGSALAGALTVSLLAAASLPGATGWALQPSHSFLPRTRGGMTCGSARRAAPAALRMAGDAPPPPKKKKFVLGPGLFDPNIQLGPEDDWNSKEKVEPAVEPKEEDKQETLLTREQFEPVFAAVDADGNGKLNSEELIELARCLGQEWSTTRATKILWRLDTDKNGMISVDEVFEWYAAGGLATERKAPEGSLPLAHTASRSEAESLFQINDKDLDGMLDQSELGDVVVSAGFELDEGCIAEIFQRLDADSDGKINFEEYYAWYSSGIDFVDFARSTTSVLFQPSDDDARRVFVRGFPWRASEQVAQRFFSRCGEVESVRMVNWTRDDLPSGRCIITFKDPESVATALEMHRNRMGKRWLEVYRVNMGDMEQVFNVEKQFHGPLIGIRGQTVQHIQSESGAKVFFETGRREVMIVKGLPRERAKAWAMAEEIMSENTMTAHPVLLEYHGRLIGAGGKVKTQMEQESGAHIVYAETPRPECRIYGTEEARVRAWQLVEERLWDLEHACEERFSLKRKYHGTLIGKGSATVQAMQEETGARIRFESRAPPGEEEHGGLMIIRGTPEQCSRAWKIAMILVQELPTLLSELREEDIALGALRSLPLSPGDIWQSAVDTAMRSAVKQVPRSADEAGDSPPPLKTANLDAATTVPYVML